MLPSTLVALPCQIERSAFSDERVFTISLPGGKQYVGAASRIYCWNEQGNRLGPAEPAEGEAINGYVAARAAGREGDLVLVSVPDGQTIKVEPSQLTDRPQESAENVPV